MPPSSGWRALAVMASEVDDHVVAGLLGFTRALRVAGMTVSPESGRVFLAAVSILGMREPDAVRAAGHACLCSSPGDRALHDRVFDAWFGDPELAHGPSNEHRRRNLASSRSAPCMGEPGEVDDGDEADDARSGRAISDVEVLRHRDLASLTSEQQAILAALVARLEVTLPARRSTRRRPSRRGEVDLQRTLRRAMRSAGEVQILERRSRRPRPRPVVLLIDVSGSMRQYSATLLRFAHRVATSGQAAPVEVYSIGTRVTRLTPMLRGASVEEALAVTGRDVRDWSGGTRLGFSLQALMERSGRREMLRGAVVVMFSDGWESDPTLLGRSMETLHRLAHHVIWVNPHLGRPGYEPIQAGVRAALPHVDRFLAGHSIATLASVLDVMAEPRANLRRHGMDAGQSRWPQA